MVRKSAIKPGKVTSNTIKTPSTKKLGKYSTGSIGSWGSSGSSINPRAYSMAGKAAGSVVNAIANDPDEVNMGAEMGSSALTMAGSGAAIGTMIAPGAGTVIGAGVGAIGGAAKGYFTAKNQEEELQEQQEKIKRQQRQQAFDEKMKGQQNINYRPVLEEGGDLLNEFDGPDHNNGGINIGVAEVEGGETKYKNYIFSKKLKNKETGNSFAEDSKKIDKKYGDRDDTDRFVRNAKERELDSLMEKQRAMKQKKDDNNRKKMQDGGRIPNDELSEIAQAQAQYKSFKSEADSLLEEQHPEILEIMSNAPENHQDRIQWSDSVARANPSVNINLRNQWPEAKADSLFNARDMSATSNPSYIGFQGSGPQSTNYGFRNYVTKPGHKVIKKSPEGEIINSYGVEYDRSDKAYYKKDLDQYYEEGGFLGGDSTALDAMSLAPAATTVGMTIFDMMSKPEQTELPRMDYEYKPSYTDYRPYMREVQDQFRGTNRAITRGARTPGQYMAGRIQSATEQSKAESDIMRKIDEMNRRERNRGEYFKFQTALQNTQQGTKEQLMNQQARAARRNAIRKDLAALGTQSGQIAGDVRGYNAQQDYRDQMLDLYDQMYGDMNYSEDQGWQYDFLQDETGQVVPIENWMEGLNQQGRPINDYQRNRG